jgi:hypothetical protein
MSVHRSQDLDSFSMMMVTKMTGEKHHLRVGEMFEGNKPSIRGCQRAPESGQAMHVLRCVLEHAMPPIAIFYRIHWQCLVSAPSHWNHKWIPVLQHLPMPSVSLNSHLHPAIFLPTNFTLEWYVWAPGRFLIWNQQSPWLPGWLKDICSTRN